MLESNIKKDNILTPKQINPSKINKKQLNLIIFLIITINLFNIVDILFLFLTYNYYLIIIYYLYISIPFIINRKNFARFGIRQLICIIKIKCIF